MGEVAGARGRAVAGPDPAGGRELPDQRHAPSSRAHIARDGAGQGGGRAGQRRARRASTREQADAIRGAAAEIVGGQHHDAVPDRRLPDRLGHVSSNMNMNEVLASLAAPGRRRRAPQRPRQRQPVQQRHLPDLDPRGRDARRPRSDLLPALDHLATALEAKAEEFAGRREVRAHPPDGRDPGDARPGVRRLRRDRAATASSGSSRRCPGSPSCRSAARRSAPASTPRRASPPRVIAELAEATGLPFTEARNHFEAQGARDALVELSGQLRTDRGRPDQDLQRPALDVLGPDAPAWPRSTCPTCSRARASCPARSTRCCPRRR